jgi:hypothetical protein
MARVFAQVVTVEIGPNGASPNCGLSKDLVFVIVANPLDRSRILTVNGGSSSLKFAIFGRERAELAPARGECSGSIERISLSDAQARVIGSADAQDPWPVGARDLGPAAGRLDRKEQPWPLDCHGRAPVRTR